MGQGHQADFRCRVLGAPYPRHVPSHGDRRGTYQARGRFRTDRLQERAHRREREKISRLQVPVHEVEVLCDPRQPGLRGGARIREGTHRETKRPQRTFVQNQGRSAQDQSRCVHREIFHRRISAIFQRVPRTDESRRTAAASEARSGKISRISSPAIDYQARHYRSGTGVRPIRSAVRGRVSARRLLYRELVTLARYRHLFPDRRRALRPSEKLISGRVTMSLVLFLFHKIPKII